MTKQSFIYDSDELVPNTNNPFNVDRTALIRAAGLTECVDIYMAVGKCIECEEDVLWVPMASCGGKVSLCPDNTLVVIGVPGRYAIGDPSLGPITLPGDVNITKEEGIHQWQIPKMCSAPTDVCGELDSRGLVSSW